MNIASRMPQHSSIVIIGMLRRIFTLYNVHVLQNQNFYDKVYAARSRATQIKNRECVRASKNCAVILRRESKENKRYSTNFLASCFFFL